MADNAGWIALHRSLTDCWLWKEKPFSKGQAWVDLLLLTNHKDVKILFNGDLIVVNRGQYLTSIRKLSERWGWSYDKVSRFLNLLSSDGMITKDSDRNRTLVTIVNYEVFQGLYDTDRTPSSEPSEHPQVNPQVTNNNDNNDNNIDSNYIYNNNLCANSNDLHDENAKSKVCKSDIDDFFERIWKLYPVKKGKGQISDSKKQKLYKIGYDELARCVERYKRYLKKNQKEKYTMNGSTFFNSGYVDYLDCNWEGGDNNGYAEGVRKDFTKEEEERINRELAEFSFTK